MKFNPSSMVHREGNYKQIGDGLYYQRSSDKIEYICRYHFIKSIYINFETGEVMMDIEYINNGVFRILPMPREYLTKNKLLSYLPKYGLDVHDDNAKDVLNYLLYLEERAEVSYTHVNLGFHRIDGELMYLHNKAIGSEINSKYHYDNELGGSHNIEPKGTFEGYKEVIDNHVIGHAPLETVTTIGFSAPVASRLRELTGLDVLFFHLYGDSSIGKTTAMIVATSAFGNPNKKENGLIKTWLATTNALIGHLKGVHGVPIGLDEASVKARDDYSSLIYQIADGQDKARQNKHGVNKSTARWSGTIIATAENSLIQKSNMNNGLRVRIFELGKIQWTLSAKHADDIRVGLFNNCSIAGAKFVEEFMKMSDEELLEAFKQCKDLVLSAYDRTDEFTSRIADKIAVIYMTAILIKEYLGININENNVLKLLVENDIKQMDDRKLYEKAYDFVQQEIVKNLNKFYHNGELKSFNSNTGEYEKQEQPRGEIYGKLVYKNNVLSEAIMTKDVFEKLLKAGNFTDTNIILAKWKEEGKIKAEKGKYTVKKVITPKTPSVRCINIVFDTSNSDSKKVAKKAPKKTKKTKIIDI